MILKKFSTVFLLFLLKTALPATETAAPINHLLILLDDSETEWGALSDDFAGALKNKAFPIIVSAHLLTLFKKPNTETFTPPKEEDVPELLTSYEPEKIRKKTDTVLYYQDYPTQIDTNWITKEINQSLYLLLPRDYLKKKNISVEDAKKTNPSLELTSAEKILGLKINHLKTVNTVTSLETKKASNALADYFIPSLESVCITNKEYNKAKIDAEAIPSTVIYMIGHGSMGNSICDLSLKDFKHYLEFLEQGKIKLFVYNSCYAAGINHEIIYKDAQKGPVKKYNFPLITLALGEEFTYSGMIHFWQDKKKKQEIKITPTTDLNCFALKTSLEEIPYGETIDCLDPKAENKPQIRYPGLEWFSVLYSNEVVSIGSVMAKTRNKPLAVASFFKRKGESAQPRAILLYPARIDFEIIIDAINSESGIAYCPQFISMIPGYAIHEIKKISSEKVIIEWILANFILMNEANVEKMFLIDEIEGRVSPSNGYTLNLDLNEKVRIKNALIALSYSTNHIYFELNNQVYTQNTLTYSITQASPKEITEYKKFLQKVRPTAEQSFTSTTINTIASTTLFNKRLSLEKAKKNILGFFERMPNNSAAKIETLSLSLTPKDSIFTLYHSIREKEFASTTKDHKLLWIDSVKINEKPLFKNLIIANNKGFFEFYYETAEPENKKYFYTLENEDEKPTEITTAERIESYKKQFQYFDEHKTLENPESKSSFNKESIEKIASVEGKKKR